MFVCASRVFSTWYACVFIHVFGGSGSLRAACRVALIRSREEAVAKRLAAGWVWFRCQKEKGRKINGLSEMKGLPPVTPALPIKGGAR